MPPVQPLKLLVIGVDGADYARVTRWLGEGRLPRLAALRDEGAFGPLRSTVPALTPPAWSTMLTGMNPGGHGVFEWFPLTGEGGASPVAARRRARTIWEALSDAGWQVGTYNVPTTYPPEPLSAFQVSGFDAPALRPDMAHPPEALQVVLSAVGTYELYPHSILDINCDFADVARHLDLPRDGINALLEAYPCDAAMVVFQVIDWLQHRHLGEPRSDGRDLVEEGYAILDERIGQILDRWCGPETTVVILSDHGGTLTTRLINLEKVFQDRGLLAYRAPGDGGREAYERRRRIARLSLSAWTLLKAKLPRLARILAPAARRARGKLASYHEGAEIDWEHTKAVPWGVDGAIRLNVQGRDAHGSVAPGEVDAVRQEVIDALMTLRDPVTREPICRGVRTREELYTGPYADEGPDLVVDTADPRCLCVSYRDTGELPMLDVQPEDVVVLDPPWCIHDPYGILLAAGPAFEPGSAPDEAGLADVVPTILAALGLPVPAGLDGRVLMEVLASSHLDSHPLRVGPPWPAPDAATGGGFSTQDDEAAVEERLRDLGYL